MWNFILPIVSTALGAALAGRKSGMQANPMQVWQQLFGQSLGTFQSQLQPVQNQVSQMAGRRGAALGQDLAGSIGAIGGFSSGAGRAAMSLGQSAQGALRATAESQYRQQLVDMARANAASLLGPQLGFQESQRSGSDNIMSWLAQLLSGGQLGEMVGGMLPQGASGGTGGPQLQANPFLQNPNLLPFTPPPNPMGVGRR